MPGRPVGPRTCSALWVIAYHPVMDDLAKLGPLAALVGTWEGGSGLDVSFHHEHDEVRDTVFRERTTFGAFGPVDNGTQCLYGLDYRTAAWRADDVDPFHTEVGYWLWDEAEGQVMRCFVVPRGTMALAGGDATADAKTFTMAADVGTEEYGIVSNRYLAKNARTIHYTVTITVADDGLSFTYEEDTVLEMTHSPEPVHHTDRNTLHRVDTA